MSVKRFLVSNKCTSFVEPSSPTKASETFHSLLLTRVFQKQRTSFLQTNSMYVKSCFMYFCSMVWTDLFQFMNTAILVEINCWNSHPFNITGRDWTVQLEEEQLMHLEAAYLCRHWRSDVIISSFSWTKGKPHDQFNLSQIFCSLILELNFTSTCGNSTAHRNNLYKCLIWPDSTGLHSMRRASACVNAVTKAHIPAHNVLVLLLRHQKSITSSTKLRQILFAE